MASALPTEQPSLFSPFWLRAIFLNVPFLLLHLDRLGSVATAGNVNTVQHDGTFCRACSFVGVHLKVNSLRKLISGKSQGHSNAWHFTVSRYISLEKSR